MIMNINELRREYNERVPLLKQLGVGVKQILSREITRKKIRIHSLHGRVKGFSSFCDKIRRKKIKEPFREIEDIVGLRVVCTFRSHVESIREIVRNNFEVIEEDDKTDNTADDIFGYLGVHFTVTLNRSFSRNDRFSLREIPFEIQVRTMGQDAWAEISHELDYKEISVPRHLRRDFYALSGLFHVADTHFEILRKERSKHLNQQTK